MESQVAHVNAAILPQLGAENDVTGRQLAVLEAMVKNGLG